MQPQRERRLWEQVLKGLEVDLSPAFLGEEWRRVVLARQVGSAPEYLSAKRGGRGRGLGTLQRAQVWQAVSGFQELLCEQGLWTYETIVEEAARLLGERECRPFDHVVVDEAQDLHPGQWRLLRAAVAEGDDDLFIAGDTHQRIYGPRVSLTEVGVNIRGRSTKLRINYRTTAQILGWGLGLMRGEKVDDMDGGLDSVADCRSEMRGSEPVLTGLTDERAELRHLVRTIRGWSEAGVLSGEIGVTARSNRSVEQVVTALEETGIPAVPLARGQAAQDAISVGTMHRMKGLEFRCLAVVGVSEGRLPPSRSLTPEEEDSGAHERDLLRERSLLFVACTRAREQLSVSWYGRPSPFIDEILR